MCQRTRERGLTYSMQARGHSILFLRYSVEWAMVGSMDIGNGAKAFGEGVQLYMGCMETVLCQYEPA